MDTNKNGKNIVLIGMPTAGKSTAGVVLAKVMGYDFLDTDLMIQRKGGARLEELIEKLGLDGFLALEEEVCSAVDAEHSVIATGGSAVYSERAMKHLKEIGVVVYLLIGWETLSQRLRDVRGRGVVLRDGETLEELYARRCVLYEKYADLVVDEGEQGLEETVRSVREGVGRMGE